MARSQLELLVLFQDIDLMLKEVEEEEENMGFSTGGKDNLKKALDDIGKNIQPRFMGIYTRLRTRYKRSIAPVRNGTCLGCCAKLPTSYDVRGREDQIIFTCESCGRILYWTE